jgi:hypothetical protein
MKRNPSEADGFVFAALGRQSAAATKPAISPFADFSIASPPLHFASADIGL